MWSTYYTSVSVVTFIQSATRVGISLGGVFNYQVEARGSVDTCADTDKCLPTFRKCVEVYHSWPGNYVEIYAWYQLRSVRWCRRNIPWGGSIVSNNVTTNDDIEHTVTL